jgi:large-conductance mechanosensitive channel
MENITSVVDSTSKTFFNVSMEFWNYIEQKNIIGLAISFIIGIYVRDFGRAFSKGIVIPILQKVKGGAVEDVKKLTVKLFGIEFKLGGLVIVTINLLIIVFILFMLQTYIPKFIQNKIRGN